MITLPFLMDTDLSRSLRMLSGVQAALSDAADARIVPLHYNQTGMLFRLLDAGGVDGIIGAFLGDRWLESLLPYNTPMINVGGLSTIHTIPTVGVDDHATGVLAARYFADHGWRHTAVVHERASCTSVRMHDGFMNAAEAVGMTPSKPPEGAICSDPGGLREWLIALPDHTGCFCTSDFLARRLAQLATEAGRVIPLQLGLLGVGDALLDTVLSPVALSTIVLPDVEIGRCAARLLLAAMADPGTPAKSLTLPPVRMIVRESTAAYSHADPLVNRALAWIDTHLFAPCGTDALARQCGASKRRLEMHFKTVLGRAPGSEWKQRRHREICRLLADTNIPIQDIAALAGAAEASNFWNAFKKMEGITPARYRAAHLARPPAF